MKQLIPFIILIFLGCSHPESSEFDRNHHSKKIEKQINSIPQFNNETFHENDSEKPLEKCKIKMIKNGGVYYIPVLVNDVKMHFIFDTGAGMVSISETEANFLYKEGSLTESDFIDTANFIDANGDVSEGAIINLKSIKIGGRTLNNVKASVVHNLNAPLLLGQTVLEQFGKISIDNKAGEITLE